MINFLKNIWMNIKINIELLVWKIEDRRYRKNIKLTDPEKGCGLYGVGIPCAKCPNYIKCWLDK